MQKNSRGFPWEFFDVRGDFMKKILISAVLVLTLCLCGCESKADKYFAEGIKAFNEDDYKIAERKLRKALDNGCKKSEAEEVIDIIKYYNEAQRCVNNREFSKAAEAVDKIPSSYEDYGISDKIDEINDVISKSAEASDTFDSIKGYYESGKFDSAVSLMDYVDEDYLSSAEKTELGKIRTQIESNGLSKNRKTVQSGNQPDKSERIAENSEKETEKPKNENKPSDSGVKYRVRKSPDDADSQLGAFSELDNAKRLADENSGYAVYDLNGSLVYQP